MFRIAASYHSKGNSNQSLGYSNVHINPRSLSSPCIMLGEALYNSLPVRHPFQLEDLGVFYNAFLSSFSSNFSIDQPKNNAFRPTDRQGSFALCKKKISVKIRVKILRAGSVCYLKCSFLRGGTRRRASKKVCAGPFREFRI